MAGKKKEEEKVEAVEEETKTEQVEAKEEVKAEKAKTQSEESKAEQSFDEPEQAAEDQGPSKLLDLKEVAAMAKTMYCALKGGVQEIVANYKAKRADTEDKADDKKK